MSFKFRIGQVVRVKSHTYSDTRTSGRVIGETFTIKYKRLSDFTHNNIYCTTPGSDWCTEQDLELAYGIIHTKLPRTSNALHIN